MGYLRPAILIPAGLLASMPASHIEAILLHELAHIRRRDYLANLLQGVAESLLFYHPAIWWISGIIRAERENCCDDIAVISGNGNAYEYATALMALEQSRWGAAELTATAATGGNLVNRVHRLLNPTKPRQRQSSGWVAPLLVMLGVVATLVAAQTPQQETKKSPYTMWLNEDVTYIVSPDERESFLRLHSP